LTAANIRSKLTRARSITATVALLGELGFNRMSVGVQDFDERVQQAVNRIQSEEETAQRHRRRARQRLQVGFGRPDLRPAAPDGDGLQPHARARAGDGSGSPVDLQLRAPAQPVQAAAPHSDADLPSADTKLQILALAIRS
jgi:oxygen-independent coproporphyrinogen-3 oxidase